MQKGTEAIAVQFPFYYWSIGLDKDGNRLGTTLEVARSKDLLARVRQDHSAWSAPIRLPQVAVNKHKWQKRLRHLSAKVWEQFREAGKFPAMQEDSQGPYVSYPRSGRSIRPKNAAP
jgi:hypothetical protein